MKKIKRNLLLGASTLMFVGAMFVFADTANAGGGNKKALHGNSAGTKFCCKDTGSGCGAKDCKPVVKPVQ